MAESADPRYARHEDVTVLWDQLRKVEDELRHASLQLQAQATAQTKLTESMDKLARSVTDIVEVWTAATTIGRATRWVASFVVSFGVVYAVFKGVRVGP